MHTCKSSVSVVLRFEEPRCKLLNEQNGNEWYRFHYLIKTLQTHYPATQTLGWKSCDLNTQVISYYRSRQLANTWWIHWKLQYCTLLRQSVSFKNYSHCQFADPNCICGTKCLGKTLDCVSREFWLIPSTYILHAEQLMSDDQISKQALIIKRNVCYSYVCRNYDKWWI